MTINDPPHAPRTPEDASAHLAAIVDSSDDAIFSKTPDGIITSWNLGAQKLYGYSADEAIGRHVSLIIPPDRSEELQRITERVKQGERVKHLETVRLAKDGREIFVSLTLSPIYSVDRRIIGISAIGRDITDRILMENLLKESEKRYRTLVEMAPDAVIVHQDGRFVYANCAALGIYGANSLQELQHCTLLDLVHPDERDLVRSRIKQLLEGEEIPLREYRLLRLNGETVSVEASSALIDYEGRPSIQSIARDITARIRADREREAMMKALTFERTRFETLLRQMPVAVMIAEAPSGRVIYSNDEWSRVLRQDLGAMEKGGDYRQLVLYRMDGSPLPADEHPMARALNGETVEGKEYRVTRGDGSHGFACVNAAAIRDTEGKIVSALAAFVDVTESRIAAKALLDSEQRLQLALDAAEMGSCDMDAGTGRGFWSLRHFLLFGYDPPETGGGPASIEMWQSRIHPEDLPQVLEGLRKAKEQGGMYRSEHRILRADNDQQVWVNVSGRFLCDQSGGCCRFIGVVYDISESKAVEDALRRSERLFRLMTDSVPQIVWTSLPDGSIDYVNMNFELYTGINREAASQGGELCRPEEMLSAIAHPDDLEPSIKAWQQALVTGGPYQTECRLRRVDGAYHWHLARAIAERDEAGGIVKWYGTATDIQDLRETQEKLRSSEAKFRWLYESNMIAVFFWNKDGAITEANGAFCDLIGYSRDECHCSKINWLELAAPEFCAADRAAVQEIMARGICKPYEKDLVNRSDGHRVSVLIAGAKMPDSELDGIGFAIDLTELKKTERALREEMGERLRAVEELALQEQVMIRQGRLAALGEMISNIAHQWRQPLNILALIVQELPRYYERDLFSKEYLDESVTRAMQIINYMSKTIDGFRKFFGPDKEKERFRAGEVLARTVSIVEAAFQELKLKIELSVDQEIAVYGYPNEFSQVVLNILMNAKDALLERKIAKPKVAIRLFGENGKAVLTISDNAGGIAPEIIEKIFDPYFTTKGPDRGTGIGLFMSKTIIEKNMNGTLSVRNAEQGAEFRIEV